MRKKRILIDLMVISYPNCGLGQVALNYAKYLRKNYTESCQYEITILVNINDIGICGDKVKYLTSSWFNRHFQWLLPKYDIWHSIHQLTRFRPRSKGTYRLITVHDINPIYEKKGERRKYYFNKLKKEFRRCNSITAISDFSRNEIVKYFDKPIEAIDVIYNGVEWLPTGTSKRPHHLQKEDGSFFFTIGQVTEKKNFHTLVEMMKYFPNKKLYIAGENATHYGKFIQKIISDQKIDNVVMLGAVSNEERIWLYQNCEAFLFPSLFEGFGLPVIEAMQFGKPVVSSAETSLKEIGGEYATFFDSFSAKSMANSVTNALQNHTTEKATAEIQYAKSYSYQKHFEKYRQKYDDILNG